MKMNDIHTRITNQIAGQDAGLWFWEEFTKKIIVKAPTHTIKEIYQGKEIFFYIKSENYFSKDVLFTGVAINDLRENPVYIFGINRFNDEIKIIEKLFIEESLEIDFYNELGIAVLSGMLRIDNQLRDTVFAEIGNCNFDDEDFIVEPYLDKFQEKYIKNRNIKHIELNINSFKVVNNHIIGEEVIEYTVTNHDEGKLLEDKIYASLDYLFKNDLYHSPYFIRQNLKVELTDIFCFSDKGTFIIETKAMSVFNVNTDITTERRIANLQKQIKKALKQVTGVCNNIYNKEIPIYDIRSDQEIIFDRTICPHCIIIVDDLLPLGDDWHSIFLEVCKQMIEAKCYTNVLDTKEFIKLVKFSNNSKYILDYYLIERCQACISNESLFVNIHFKNGEEKVIS